MLPSLVAAAPARILTSGQLGQPRGASPPSPRLTSNARGARGRPRDRPRARLTRRTRASEARGSSRGGPSDAGRSAGGGARDRVRRHGVGRPASRASPSSPALCLPRARRDVVASRRAARGPSRARLPAPPPRATPVAEAEGTPSPRATPSAGAGAASPPAPPRRRRDADPPTPAGASSSSSSSSSSSPPSSSPSRASAADAFRPELAAELRRLGLELGECLDGELRPRSSATRLDASTEEEERRAEKDDAAPADAAFDAASAASASDNAPSSSARSSAGVDAWAAAEGSTRFAVKILSSSKAKSPDAVRDFKREALLLARVDHPGIVRMHHFAALPESGDAFMVSELCAGGNVWNAVKSERATCGAMRERERRRAERAAEPGPSPRRPRRRPPPPPRAPPTRSTRSTRFRIRCRS